MAIYAKFKETGLYLIDNGEAVSSTKSILEATDISEIFEILKDNTIFEFVKG